MDFNDLMEQVLAVEYPDELEVILKRALYDAWNDGAEETEYDLTIYGYAKFKNPWRIE